ncbi:MAG: AIR synthase related protein, partial [Candidatus Lokiarchaeota archaeon]
KEINPIVQFIDENSYKSNKIHSDLGEDSAAIKNGNSYILCTTDRIITKFIENFPRGAGFSSILVSVDDIYACGGYPLAASIILSFKEEKIGNEIIKGICEASNKFHIPIIRGHTNTRSKCYELSSTVIGEVKKENYISACNAQVDDDIILAIDYDGKIGKASKYFYDTTTFKSSKQVLQKRMSMNIIAENKLVNSSKDISNGGIFGTLLQLIDYSNVGANIDISKIKIPPYLIKENYDLISFSKMYLTTSFILSAPHENREEIIDVFNKYGLVANKIGSRRFTILKQNL